MRERGAATFLAATFLLSWGVAYPLTVAFPTLRDAIFLLAVISPSVAAVTVAGLNGGRRGVRELLRRYFRWRVPGRWYAVAVLTLPLCSLGAAVFTQAILGMPMTQYLAGWSVAIAGVNAVLYLSGAAEELGWRGCLLPALLETRSPLAASVVTGVVW